MSLTSLDCFFSSKHKTTEYDRFQVKWKLVLLQFTADEKIVCDRVITPIQAESIPVVSLRNSKSKTNSQSQWVEKNHHNVIRLFVHTSGGSDAIEMKAQTFSHFSIQFKNMKQRKKSTNTIYIVSWYNLWKWCGET